MKKNMLLFIISFLVGYHTIPILAQKSYHKDYFQESDLSWKHQNYPISTPYFESQYTDMAKILNPTIPDFQVNEVSMLSVAYKENCSIAVDYNGNFIITWIDCRNGYYDIYAQRYSRFGNALGNNFKVSDDQSYAEKKYPSISADNSGNFVIVWYDERNSYGDIYAQLYSSDGTVLRGNFHVNDEIGSSLPEPSVSSDANGNFVVAWHDGRNDAWDIYAQRFSSNGTAQGSNFKVNDDVGENYQMPPSVSSDSSGNFIIVWGDNRNGDYNIHAQRYSSGGTALGSNFQVNNMQGSPLWDTRPSISVDNNGNFIITWMDERNGNYDIYAQRYTYDGTALGSNFKVNDVQCNVWGDVAPSISADNIGNFVITWYSNSDIYAQKYSNIGTTVGSNFIVNDNTNNCINPAIAMDDYGKFVISWKDGRKGYSDIYAQRYSSVGTIVGNNFKVNDDQGSENQFNSSISADNNNNFVIAWQDEREGKWDIYAQRYLNNGSAIGSNFKVNNVQGSELCDSRTSISTDEGGNFIITWDSDDIYAQRYSNNGTTVGNNFIVNDDTSGGHDPSIEVDGSGNFIIVWTDRRDYVYLSNGPDIYAQRYSSDGTALGGNFKVNDDTSSGHHATITTDQGGNYIIAWQDGRNQAHLFDGNSEIYAQRYSSDGTELGGNFKVNDDTGNSRQDSPSISSDSSGNFIIVWGDNRNGNSDIYAQRYSSDGIALGTNFKVNDDIGGYVQDSPSISSDDNGNFIISWQDYRNINIDIYAQRYSGDGVALGSNFRMTNTGEGLQRNPDVRLKNNRVYATWEDTRVGGTAFDIWANVLDWDNIVGVANDEEFQEPKAFVFYQNYPNPFNSSTKIKFTLPKSEFVKIEIFNLLGQKIETLLNKQMPAGSHKVEFTANNLPSGVYYYRMQVGDPSIPMKRDFASSTSSGQGFQQVKKMILLK